MIHTIKPKRFSSILSMAVLGMLIAIGAHGAIPHTIYFQSYLTDSSGTRVADGNYSITFSLWDGELETDNKLWEETHSVTVSGGIYSVSLGSVTTFESARLTFAVPYYLGIKVGTGPFLTVDNKFPMLASVVSSFRAKTAAGRLVTLKDQDYTATANDDILLVSGTSRITLPSAANLLGRIYAIKKIDAAGTTVTVATIGSQTIDGINRDSDGGGTALAISEQYDEITIVSDGSNWVRLGNIGNSAVSTAEIADGTVTDSDLAGSITDANINNDLTIDGGSIDNTPIGSTTPSSGAFTTLSAGETLTAGGSSTLGDAATDTVTVNGTLQNATPLVFEGATDDTFETSLSVTDPTVDRTITLPDASGTVALTSEVTTLSDSSVNDNDAAGGDLSGTYPNPIIAANAVGSAEISDGTVADADLAGSITDANINNDLTIDGGSIDNTPIGSTTPNSGAFTTLSAGETLTASGNTTLGDAATDTVTVNGTLQNATPLVFEGATDDTFETSLSVADPTADRTIALPDASGTVALTSEVTTLSGNSVNDDDAAGGDLAGTYPDPTIAANAIGSAEITDGTVASADIADGTIADADISATAAIVDTKLATIATAGKVSDSALSATVSLLGQSIESSEIADGTITDADLDGSITDAKVNNDLTIDGGSIDNSAIGSATPSSGAFTDVEIGSINAFYLGNPTTQGTWRIMQSGSDLIFQRLDTAPNTWVTKLTIKQ